MNTSDQPSLPDTPKRFVAGAKCPQCQAVDKIVMFRRNGVQHQECVSCGHHAEMVFEQNFRELETRVNRTEAERAEEVTPVRFVDPA
ncbi:MAG: YheV family putative zinc ribbon protein [Pseudomonadales bacterium]